MGVRSKALSVGVAADGIVAAAGFSDVRDSSDSGDARGVPDPDGHQDVPRF